MGFRHPSRASRRSTSPLSTSARSSISRTSSSCRSSTGPAATSTGRSSSYASYDKGFSYAAAAATRAARPPHSLEFTPRTDTPRSIVAHRTRDEPDGCRGLIGRRSSVGHEPAAAEKRGPRKPSAESMAYTAAMRGEREAKRRRTPRRDPNAGIRGIRPVVADVYSTTLATAS